MLIPALQAQYYLISTVAGNGQAQFTDAGGAAANAAGNVFVS